MHRLLSLALVVAGCGILPPEPGAFVAPTGTVAGQLRVFQRVRSAGTSPVPTRVPLPAPPPTAPGGGGPALSPHLLQGALQHLPAGEHVIPGDILVRFEQPGVEVAAALGALALAGYRVEHAGHASRYLQLLRYRHPDGGVPSVDETLGLAAVLAGRPGVRFTTVNRWHFPTATPDDPLYKAQWHYRTLNLPTAWDTVPRAPGVVVAVVDSGIRSHPDLDPRVLPGADTVSDPLNAGDGDGRDADPNDPGGDLPRGASSWHGTHVAGTVGASTNNASGVSGVGWEVSVLPVRVVGRMGGTTADVLAGIEWAVGGEVPDLPGRNPNPAQVVNLSLGTTSAPDPAYQDTIDRASARGVVFVVAAGNEAEATSLKVPCNQQRVVCVGATRLDGTRATYSNFGPQVDVMAPGGEGSEDVNLDGLPDAILSTYLDQAGNPGYGFLQGTSMAAPHVSGVVALMRAANPGLGPAQVEDLLKASAAASFRCPEGCGAGLVNAQAAVLRAVGRPRPGGGAQLFLPVDGLFLSGARPAGLIVTNTGGATLQVTASFTPTGAATVRFPTGETLEVPPGEMRVLQVAAAVEGVAPGLYEGTLQVAPVEGTPQTLPVRIRVGRPPETRPALVAVVSRDPLGRWRVVAETEALAEQDYFYEVDVPAGVYFVLAGIDEDEDGDFFEPGERSGAYQTVDAPEPVVVVAGERTEGISFDLVPYAPEDSAGRSSLGASCDEAADCPGGVCDLSFPGGYCTLDCSDASCPAGSACRPVGSAQVCLATCDAPGTGQDICRQGQVCVAEASGGGSCQPRCAGGSCGSGRACNPATGYCEPAGN